MSVSQTVSPVLTPRSILVDSSRRRSDRVTTGPDECSSSSRPRMHSLTSRMRSAYSRTADARSALCCCVLVVSLLLLIVLLFPRSHRPHHHFPCGAPQCRDFVTALAASINASLDPCQDFHSYVCDRWRPSFGGRSMLEDSAIGFRRRVGERAARTSPPRQSQDSHEKAVMLYKSCVAERTRGIGEFKRFLRERRLPWPKVDTRASIVEVAVDLSVNWHFPLFFYVYRLFSTPGPAMSPGMKHLSARFVFTDDFLGLGPRLLLKERELRKNNTEYICQLRDALMEPGDEQSEAVSCEQLDKLQREVLGDSTATSGNESLENETSTLYDNIVTFADNLTPFVSGHYWFWLLTRDQPVAVISDAVHRVEVYNKMHMRKVGALFGSNRRQTDLLLVAGLCVVQGLGRFASNQLATLIYGDDIARARRHPDLCYGLVDQMVPRLLSSPYIALLLDIERVTKATEVFQAVKSAVGKYVRRAAWLNGAARPEVFARINRSVLNFEAVLTGEAAGVEVPSHAATVDLPDLGEDFIDNLSIIPHTFWDGVHRDLSVTPSWFGFAPGNRLQSMRAPAQRTLWWGDVWHQHNASPFFALSPRDVVIPNLYVLESVFPTAAYESVNYGLMGSLIARQLLTMSFRVAGTDGSHKSRLDQLATKDSVRCVQEAFQRGDLNGTEFGEDRRDTDAMLVAVASLKPLLDALSASPGYPEWNLGFEDYSAEQLFFLALCFPSCVLREDEMEPWRGLNQASWCNVPLMLFDAFGEAFHCPPGRAMNPRSKCAAW
ncbi:endothelin-converting enzyme-like 1 [Dermacentor andersoni]|uniref:endothelin-converting enzyme-like 1 n=1 Tax=Dermacentor andersoni TaxID=34620 RepID=UPI0021555EA8|nr:endothelin-converting enzyme 1-like [Dermacentor andersoni]